MSYINAQPEWGPAELANKIVWAEKCKALDDSVKPLAEQYRDRALCGLYHPDLESIDFDGLWRGIAHLENGAGSNLLKIPDGPMLLNTAYYPTRLERPIPVDDDGNTVLHIEVDEYPEHIGPSPFVSLAWHEHMLHPMLELTKEQKDAGWRVFPCVSKLGIPLDDIARLPYELAVALNRKFNFYRPDMDGIRGDIIPIVRLGGVAADIALFRRHADDIARILKRDVEFDADTGTANKFHMIDRSKSKPVYPVQTPASFPFDDNMRIKGAVYIGRDVDTHEDVTVPFQDLSHFVNTGASGYGKSTLMHTFMNAFMYNIDEFEEIIGVDLKGGVELARYEGLTDKFTLVDNYANLHDVVDRLVPKMDERFAQMRKDKATFTREPLIAFVIDEYGVINMQDLPDKAAQDRHKRTIAKINDLAMRGRAAGLKIFACLQKATTDSMTAAVRNNLTGRICFRVPDTLTASLLFGGEVKELSRKPTELQQGQFIFDNGDGVRRVLQGPFIGEGDPVVVGTSE